MPLCADSFFGIVRRDEEAGIRIVAGGLNLDKRHIVVDRGRVGELVRGKGGRRQGHRSVILLGQAQRRQRRVRGLPHHRRSPKEQRHDGDHTPPSPPRDGKKVLLEREVHS